jgi:hypothetical protein
MAGTLAVTGDADADRLLNHDPLALMIGMLLDQQIAIELAFLGPARLAQRLGGQLDADVIASMPPDDFVEICRTKPALHRFPASMAGRIQDMCRHIVDRYDGDTAAIWRRVRRASRCRDSDRRRSRSSWPSWPSASAVARSGGRTKPESSPMASFDRWPTSTRGRPSSRFGRSAGR